jgi:hypothetical protein
MAGGGEAVHVADLGHEDGRRGATHAVDGLDGPVADVVSQPPVDLGLEHGDLPVVDLDQVPQRLHPDLEAPVQGGVVEEALALGTEEVIELGQHSLFGQHGVHLGLEPRSQRHQLGPVAHELPRLPQLRWGDPRLGQVVAAEAMGDLGASPSSFFTRRAAQCRPEGCTRCTVAPLAWSKSTAKYQP